MKDKILIYQADKHYDLLATIHPDPPKLQKYMAQWDGPMFFEALYPFEGKKFLEVGIGLGRITKTILENGGTVTGLDVSKKSLESTALILKNYSDRLVLINCDILNYVEANSFDAAYSVLTFLHIKDKKSALSNMITSLVDKGRLVISVETPDISYENTLFEDGSVKYRPEYFPNEINEIVEIIQSLNCRVDYMRDLVRTIPDGTCTDCGRVLAKLVVATKNGGGNMIEK